MTKKRVYVVPHSHWDREWYFTIEDSNILLAENMDHLIHLLENNEDYHGYVFDAQLSIVEEYLKVRPLQFQRLRQLVEAKRIFVGPWYTQADSLLVHKESLVRNLLYGVKGSKRLGHSMNIGYLPDIFGQNRYLPSIFKGFGMDYAILQRGLYTDELDENLNFIWGSPDGAQVQANLIHLGYGPGKFLSSDEEFHKGRLQPMLEKLAKLNRDTNHLLLPAGGDQVLVRDHFPETINKLNEKDDTYEYVLSDYETYMNETWNDQSFDHMIEGELLATENSRIHRTIKSQRYDIKKLNHIAEHKIINQLEPLALIGQSVGLRYPQEWLDLMWKELFDVHAHDSIGGCNSDDTNQDIVKRLVKVNRQADGLMNVIKKQMTSAVSESQQMEDILLIFNTLPKPHTTSVSTVLFTRSKEFSIQTVTHETLPFTITKQEYLSGGKKIVVTADGDKEVEIPGYYRTELLLAEVKIPSLGYTTLQVVNDTNPSYQLEQSEDSSIQNEFFEISLENGRLNLKELAAELSVNDFIQFEDTADAGDSYDYSPLPGDLPILSGKASLEFVNKSEHVEKMVIKHHLSLPPDLESRKNNGPHETLSIETHVELRKDEPLVRVEHKLDNQIKDHRVRVLLKTPVHEPKESFGDQGYSLIHRSTEEPRLKDWRENGYKEAPVPIYTIEQFAGVSGEAGTMAAFTKGLKEYEVLKHEGQLALTLYRSVGLLGRDDLLWRPGRASGINNKVVTTPDAQMQETMSFEYALSLSGNTGTETEYFELADRYLERYVTYQHQSLNTFEERLDRFEIPQPLSSLPLEYSLLAIENKDVFVSTVKRAHEKPSGIMRVFNPTSSPVDLKLSTEQPLSFDTVNLAEEKTEKDAAPILSKGYQTICIHFEEENGK
ncbi:alpha-mannosidase [Halobacillus salinarum]|uniref:Alpha-mannosidase n=1 Tax=Halobacillus salinarum TaxID=2932257 RepID=A0ABY4EKW7_9BACI|nr:glycoside hydrolase family 38 C-terminal domain-containing protein [Halobacillus salinarum]UOQ45060.1 alpha-mannosidase [Halobacillus salinarum]